MFKRTRLHALVLFTAFFAVAVAQVAYGANLPLSKRGGIDIDGSGKSVLLLRSKTSSQLQVGRFANNTFTFSSQADPGANYRLVAVADFDGDGISDLAYQDMSLPGDFGVVSVWPDFVAARSYVLRNVKRAWIVQAAGDLDGDGFADLAFRFTGDDGIPNDTGVSYVWFQKAGGAYDLFRKRGGAPLTWTLIGAADLNGDGAMDMVYIDPYGQLRALMATSLPAPGRFCANLSVNGTVPQGYTALQISDFTGNGRGDILARNSITGDVSLVSLNANGLNLPPSAADPNDLNAACTSSSSVVAATTLALPSTNVAWQFYAAGDFNGDGIFDIAWLKPDGTLAVWLMAANGGAPTVVANAGTAPTGFSPYKLGAAGGAPGTTLSGTASAGAPIVGYMTLKDSASPQHVINNIAIDVNGKYSVDVGGLTPPFMISATGTVAGRTIQYYTAAAQADLGGTINVTPFTDLIVRNAAAGLADAMFNNSATMSANLTTAQLDAQRVQLTTALGPVLQAAGLSASLDLLRAAFNADSTGIDRFMDLVHVVPGSSASQYLIQNILDTSASITVNTTTAQVSGSVSTSGITSTATTPFDLIQQTFTTLSGYFATSLPSPSNPSLLALFAGTFKQDGASASAFLTQITGDSSLIGLSFANLSLLSVDLNAGTAKVSFTPRFANGTTDTPLTWQMKKTGNSWLLDGNQHIATIQITATAQKQVNVLFQGQPNCAAAYTGLSITVKDEAHVGVNSALVTGPGLPQGGLTLVPGNDPEFVISRSTQCPIASNDYPMTDSVLNGANAPGDGSTYTFALYAAGTPGGAPMATYTAQLFKAPVTNANLSGVAFPTIDNASVVLHSIPANGGNVAVNWTLPAGTSGDDIDFCVGTNNNGCTNNLADLTGRVGSGISTIVLPTPAAGTHYVSGGISVGANDAFYRHIRTLYN